MTMSEAERSAHPPVSAVTRPRESLEEQARRKGVQPIMSVDELARDDIWVSDEELDAFLAHVYAERRTGLA